MIFSFGPLMQDAFERVRSKGQDRSEFFRNIFSFNTEMGKRLSHARTNGVPGLTGVRLLYKPNERAFQYICNLDDETIIVENNPQVIMGDPEGAIGIEISIAQEIPASILDTHIGKPFREIGASQPILNSLIGHLPINEYKLTASQTMITLDDSAYRIRVSEG